jgi:hypothetical protein
VFEREPNHAEVLEQILEQVRIDLHWNEPSDGVELERGIVWDRGFGMHICWKTMRINSEQRWVAFKEAVVESQARLSSCLPRKGLMLLCTFTSRQGRILVETKPSYNTPNFE